MRQLHQLGGFCSPVCILIMGSGLGEQELTAESFGFKSAMRSHMRVQLVYCVQTGTAGVTRLGWVERMG